MSTEKNQMRVALFGHIANLAAGNNWAVHDIADAVDQVVDRWMPEKKRDKATGHFAPQTPQNPDYLQPTQNTANAEQFAKLGVCAQQQMLNPYPFGSFSRAPARRG